MLRLLIVQLLALILCCSGQRQGVLNRDNFDESVADGRSIVMFGNNNNPLIQPFATAANSNENQQAQINFFRVNCNESPGLCSRFQRRNQEGTRPFFILFEDGQDLAQYVNSIDINEIIRGFRIAATQGLPNNSDYPDYSDYSIGRRGRGAGSLGLLELGLLGGLGGFPLGGLPFGFF